MMTLQSFSFGLLSKLNYLEELQALLNHLLLPRLDQEDQVLGEVVLWLKNLKGFRSIYISRFSFEVTNLNIFCYVRCITKGLLEE